jgi:hypothetical protein
MSFLKQFSALMCATARLGLGRLLAQVTPSDLRPPFRDEARQRGHRQGDVAGFIDQ